MENAGKQARRIVAKHTQHGISRRYAKKTGVISSIGTERNYRQCLKNYLEWCALNGVHPDCQAKSSNLQIYLKERSEWIEQKNLNQIKHALELIYKQKLPNIRAMKKSIYEKRSYKLVQVQKIVEHQNPKNRITTLLAFFTGIRAHEAATILPIAEQPPSKRLDKWDPRRFTGLNEFILYSVIGKGGLIRAVAVPKWLATQLEATRRDHPIVVLDREVQYSSSYDIGYGQSWSQSFTTASTKSLGYSTGGHGLRHSYAKWRLWNLIFSLELEGCATDQGSIEEQALLIVSQELGHFRLDIVYCYIR